MSRSQSRIAVANPLLSYMAVALCLLPPPEAQSVRSQAKPTIEQDQALQLFKSADSLPIEFRADIQLEVIESAKLPSGTDVESNLEQLFRDAEDANFKYPLKVIPAAAGQETLERELTSALAFFNLDTLSIRIRVTRETWKSDRLKAKAELAEIQPQISAVGCESPVVPNLGNRYKQLGLLAAEVFATSEKGASDHADWLLAQIQGIQSASQLAPIAVLVVNSTMSKNDFERLMVGYVSIMRQLKTTDRELATIQENPDGEELTLPYALRKLVDKYRDFGLWPGTVLDGYRAFLLNNSAATPCMGGSSNWTRILDDFNHLARQVFGDQNAPTLEIREVERGDGVPERAHFHHLPQTDSIDPLFGKILQIRNGEQNSRPEEREAGVRKLEGIYAEFLNQIDALNPSTAACEAGGYFKKAKLLLVFFDQAPSRYYQSQILDRLTTVLATSPLQSDWRVLWLFQVKLLLNFSRSPSKEQAKQIAALKTTNGLIPMLPSSLGSQILVSMKQSSDFVMDVYASADEVLKTRFFSPYLN